MTEGSDRFRVSSARMSARLSSSNIWRNSGREIFSRSSLEADDEEALKWAALEKLPTYLRVRRGILTEEEGQPREIDITNLGLVERKNLVERLLKIVEEDNEEFLLKLKKRIDRVGLNLPTIEVRFEHLNVDAEAYVGSRALPTIFNFTVNMLEGFFSFLHILPSPKKPLPILHDVSGIIKPGRMTLLLGPPTSGKTTLLLALAGKLDTQLKASGRVTYNGHEMHEFIPQRTSAYISQHDQIVNSIRQSIHILQGTAIISLLQPYSYVSADEFSEAFQSFHVGQKLGDEISIPFHKEKSHPAALTMTLNPVTFVKEIAIEALDISSSSRCPNIITATCTEKVSPLSSEMLCYSPDSVLLQAAPMY